MNALAVRFRALTPAPLLADKLLARAGVMPTLAELKPHMEGELKRARRYARPLSLLVMGLLARGAGAAVHKSGGARRTSVQLDTEGADASALRAPAPLVVASAAGTPTPPDIMRVADVIFDALRETDLVTVAPEAQQLVALLPETDAAAAVHAARRYASIMAERAQLGATAGVAGLQGGADNLDALIAQARAALVGQPLHLVVPVAS